MGEHYSKKELGKDMYQFFIEDENAAEDFVTIEAAMSTILKCADG